MPVKLSESLQIYFKKLWLEVHSPVFSGKLSSLRRSSLAESIFRMSMNASDQLQKPLTRNIIRRSIFGTDITTFENFMLNHWEMQPLYLARCSKLLQEQDDIFSSIKKTLAFDENFQDLSLFLQKLVSCPPITSDELDILGYLEEARCHLGLPISYQQDIRVLKTEHMKGEVHYFQEDSHILCKHDILRCDRAFEDGYTIALRGMEFRLKKIAEIVDGLASLFGQPSAGINMYITPPNSQGLARHYDDHCVLVVQLYGVKKWTVYCKSGPDLPRLYGSFNSLNVMEASNLSGDDTCLQYLLKEGDVLYIPRGFPHEAHTVVDNDMTRSSLHLTLSLEVELPFEWEGFVHVAFFSWNHKQNKSDQSSSDPLSTILNDLALKLVHVSISLLANSYPTFQKACLVGAVPEPSDSCDWLSTNQREIFRELIKQVEAESNFLYIVKHMSSSLEKNEDPLQQLRWLRNLEDDSAEKHVSLANEHIILCNRYKDEAGAAFCQVKSRFCSEVVFDEARPYYIQLLKKYRKTREKYMNGMLLGFADADCLM
ncbi:uncharacterized protein LOC124911377 [Impatiens glandulifera]|uniref:uncharacterized protein LOC124911377 n=1 Tax=Impatiens glandulifera TaxID=253017 RepID=UPI001FB153F6|nr:uncharacterized protein LOC124911377 [Impatiens glandulifera]